MSLALEKQNLCQAPKIFVNHLWQANQNNLYLKGISGFIVETILEEYELMW